MPHEDSPRPHWCLAWPPGERRLVRQAILSAARGTELGFLRLIGAAIIILWLVLWLAVKITFGAIHLLVALGVVLLVIGFLKAPTR